MSKWGDKMQKLYPKEIKIYTELLENCLNKNQITKESYLTLKQEAEKENHHGSC